MSESARNLTVVLEQAIRRIQRASDTDWFLAAEHGVRVVAARKQILSSDDVWEWLRDFDVETKDNRAMGGVMLNAHRDKVIAPLPQWRTSRRPACHSRPIRMWKSLVIQ